MHAASDDAATPVKPLIGLGPLSLLRDVAISVALAVILIVFIYQPVKVEGTSMMPGLTDQERIFVNKYEYKLGANNIHRGIVTKAFDSRHKLKGIIEFSQTPNPQFSCFNAS